jgi:large repetitive protein
MVSAKAWNLDTATVAPLSGTMPSSGLTSYAKITATATDAEEKPTTVIFLNRSTVNSYTGNDITPLIPGRLGLKLRSIPCSKR